MIRLKEYLLSFSGLFTSLSTIMCCALPIILVTFGMGSVFASITTIFPFINWVAEKSIYFFFISLISLLTAGYFIFIKPQSCPADKNMAKICYKSKKLNKIIWYLSVIILGVSFFFKYILILLIT